MNNPIITRAQPVKPMRTKTVKLSDEVKDIINRSTISGNSLTLPGQLDRKLYVEVNRIIEVCGGKWNKKAKAHVFDGNPLKQLGMAVSEGEVVDVKKTFNQFFTPPEIANDMVRELCIQSNDSILEPSAGDGALLRALPKECLANTTAIEIDFDLVVKLSLDFLSVRVIGGDFRHMKPGDHGIHPDRIIMNPPFERGVDIHHIFKAYEFLNPEGCLVALCADRPALKEWALKKGGWFQELEDGSFKSAGTGVRVAMLKVWKPA